MLPDQVDKKDHLDPRVVQVTLAKQEVQDKVVHLVSLDSKVQWDLLVIREIRDNKEMLDPLVLKASLVVLDSPDLEATLVIQAKLVSQGMRVSLDQKEIWVSQVKQDLKDLKASQEVLELLVNQDSLVLKAKLDLQEMQVRKASQDLRGHLVSLVPSDLMEI